MSNTNDLGSIEKRIAQLETTVGGQDSQVTRRRRVTLTTGIVLVLVCVVALTSLTNLASQLDANALTQIGRQAIEKRLPSGRADFSRFLIAESPRVVRGTFISLLETLPKLRELLVRDVKVRLHAVTDQFEEELATQMETSVRASKQLIDERFPSLNNEQKIAKLVELISADFNRNIDIALDAIYPEFVAEIDRIKVFVGDLGTYDDEQLTKTERMQKELIRTLLKLMVLEKSKKGV